MRVAGALMLAALVVGSSPVRVVGGADDFMRPAAGGGYLAWSQNSRGHPRHFDAFVRRGRTTWKMNAPGTSGLTGGIDRGHVVYAQIRGGAADLYDFDIGALRRHRI